MNFLEALLITICSFLVVAVMIFVPFMLASLVDKLIEKYRRYKYPEYFEIYDKAYSKALEVSKDFSDNYGRIRHRFEMYREGLLEGECTDIHFRKAIQKFEYDYIELATWYRNETKEVEQLFRCADKYAKEHNIKWGELY